MQIQGRQGLLVRSDVRGFGVFFVVFARQYDMGTAARMGPAFFPTMLGGLLFAARCRRCDTGADRADQERAGRSISFQAARLRARRWWRSAAAATRSLLVSLAALVMISSFGSDEFRLRDVLLLTVFLAVLVMIVSSTASA